MQEGAEMEQTVFQERLKRAIFLNGIKKSDLAERVGIDRSKISAYVSGRYKPNGETLTKIAAALGVSSEWLLGKDDIMAASITRSVPGFDDVKAMTDEEMELVEKWRAADEPRKQIVRLALGMTSVP